MIKIETTNVNGCFGCFYRFRYTFESMSLAIVHRGRCVHRYQMRNAKRNPHSAAHWKYNPLVIVSVNISDDGNRQINIVQSCYMRLHMLPHTHKHTSAFESGSYFYYNAQCVCVFHLRISMACIQSWIAAASATATTANKWIETMNRKRKKLRTHTVRDKSQTSVEWDRDIVDEHKKYTKRESKWLMMLLHKCV